MTFDVSRPVAITCPQNLSTNLFTSDRPIVCMGWLLWACLLSSALTEPKRKRLWIVPASVFYVLRT